MGCVSRFLFAMMIALVFDIEMRNKPLAGLIPVIYAVLSMLFVVFGGEQ